MSDSAARAQRASALEEKRRRLEDLKNRRSKRTEDTAAVRANASANLDDYIDGLLSQPASTTTTETSTAAVLASPPKESTSVVSDTTNTVKSNVIAEAAAPAPPIPKTVETFSVSTQTDFVEAGIDESDDTKGDNENKEAFTDVDNENGGQVNGSANKLADLIDPKVLSSDEIANDIKSNSIDFTSFISTASKKVERMLGTPMLNELLADYVGEADDINRVDTKEADASRFVTSSIVLECAQWTSSRDLTDLDWSPLHRDYLLSTYHLSTATVGQTYGKNDGATLNRSAAAVSAITPKDTPSASLTPRSSELQSDGLALVWSLAMPNRPEHVFTCGSPVTVGRFHPTEAPLVLGGCESGQLVVWDVRAGRLPVQKSTLTTVAGASSKGHVHPICAMERIEGTGLVTASTDGRVNFWSLANLRDPVDSMMVADSVSCLAVPPESDMILLGDEHGSLYAASASTQSGGQRSSRRSVRKLENSETASGHYGMITSLATKVMRKGSSGQTSGLSKGFLRGVNGLVLSSGVDWTIQLWAPAYNDTPLCSLVSHSYDYMPDVQWSPTHPSLFATASSNGTVGFWNLAQSMDEPLTGPDSIVVSGGSNEGNGLGLNKLKWSQDGTRLAATSGDKVHVLNLAEELTQVKGDEEQSVMNELLARGWIGKV